MQLSMPWSSLPVGTRGYYKEPLRRIEGGKKRQARFAGAACGAPRFRVKRSDPRAEAAEGLTVK
jgi:hypothetical protein